MRTIGFLVKPKKNNKTMSMNFAPEWIKKANADLDIAKTLMEIDNPHIEIIGFPCQQAVEKYMKAYIELRSYFRKIIPNPYI